MGFAPIGVAAGSLWSSYVTFDPATPQVHAVDLRIACCVAACFLLAALTMLLRRRPGSARSAGRIAQVPVPAWRAAVGLYAWLTAMTLLAYENAEPVTWRWRHSPLAFGAEMGLFALSAVLMVWNWRHQKRLQRPRDPQL